MGIIFNKVNALIGRVGMDKVAHFFGGMAIVAIFGMFGCALVGLIVDIIVMAFREVCSPVPDWKDFVVGLLGGLIPSILSLLWD